MAFAAIAGFSSCVWAQGPGTNESLSVTGMSVPALASLDETMSRFLTERKIPGGGLAVMQNGRLVYNRGFGYAFPDKGELWQPSSLCRIASISKPITATAVMQLVQSGKVKLNEPVLQQAGLQPWTKPGTQPDARIWKITVLQCLQHRAGWDRDASGYDPINYSQKIALDMKVPSPATAEAIVRHTLGTRQLDYEPGTKYVYANVDYLILGRLIEKVTGQTYEAYCREKVLAPAGIADMQIGRTLYKYRLPGEVVYYDPEPKPYPSVFDEDMHAMVPCAYGSMSIESIDANGGWVGTPSDLLKFMSALSGTGSKALISRSTLTTMTARPAGESTGDHWYACGLNLFQSGQMLGASHTGSLGGCCFGSLSLRGDGTSFAFLCNRGEKSGEHLSVDLEVALHQVINDLGRKVASN